MEIIDKCIELEFKTAHEIHQHLRKLTFKKGSWSIQIFETKKPGNIICPFYGNGTIRPSKYIGNTDEHRPIKGRVPYRWEIIQKEMDEMKIEKLTVKVCPIIVNKNR
jgi:hypothetical protein